MPDPLLRAENIRRSFGRRAVLRGVNLAVEPGALVGVVGENGAGKSTLLRILAGELRPNGGAIHRAGALGYCPQAVILNDTLTVNQHLAYFAAAYDLRDLSYTQTLISRLGYEQYRTTPAGVLSGGTRQKVNLTLALMHQPDVLLLDEPYQGFDWETYLRFWELAEELRRQGRAVLVISHLLFDQQRFDALYRLENGQLAPITVQRGAATSEAGEV
ncbi:MAG TPA: ABC transporter ATP-binding protein [Ktedonobacterales bacterium]|nr:ABC transporter ATP-binding protein [Ktedonobacterales bacterium]